MSTLIAKIAQAIDDIPGNPSSLEIARVSIEEYQRAIWPAAFDTSYSMRRTYPELRRARASNITANIMHIVRKYIYDNKSVSNASRELMETLYESGAEIITDADRAVVGLSTRDSYGLTSEELRIIEARRIQVTLGSIQPMIFPR